MKRQQFRRDLFERAFLSISRRFPGEPRRMRRRMALAWMHREWRERPPIVLTEEMPK